MAARGVVGCGVDPVGMAADEARESKGRGCGGRGRGWRIERIERPIGEGEWRVQRRGGAQEIYRLVKWRE